MPNTPPERSTSPAVQAAHRRNEAARAEARRQRFAAQARVRRIQLGGGWVDYVPYTSEAPRPLSPA